MFETYLQNSNCRKRTSSNKQATLSRQSLNARKATAMMNDDKRPMQTNAAMLKVLFEDY